MSNLPTTNPNTGVEIKKILDKFYQQEISFPSEQIDATVNFFLKNGFDVESARSTAIVLLNQSKIDNVDVFQVLDTLKTLSDVQLNQLVAQLLNSYRENTSLLGYKIRLEPDEYTVRNILV